MKQWCHFLIMSQPSLHLSPKQKMANQGGAVWASGEEVKLRQTLSKEGSSPSSSKNSSLKELRISRGQKTSKLIRNPWQHKWDAQSLSNTSQSTITKITVNYPTSSKVTILVKDSSLSKKTGRITILKAPLQFREKADSKENSSYIGEIMMKVKTTILTTIAWGNSQY